MLELKIPQLKMPQLKMPKLKMPKLKMPQLKMPKLKMPKLKMPKLKTIFFLFVFSFYFFFSFSILNKSLYVRSRILVKNVTKYGNACKKKKKLSDLSCIKNVLRRKEMMNKYSPYTTCKDKMDGLVSVKKSRGLVLYHTNTLVQNLNFVVNIYRGKRKEFTMDVKNKCNSMLISNGVKCGTWIKPVPRRIYYRLFSEHEGYRSNITGKDTKVVELDKQYCRLFFQKIYSRVKEGINRVRVYMKEDNMMNFLWVCKNVLWKRSIFFLTIFVMIHSAVISIVIPRFDNLIFNDLTNRKFDDFFFSLCNCILARVVNMCLCGLRNYIFMITSSDCLKKVKRILFDIYLNKEYEYYDKVDYNTVINKVTVESHDFSDIIPYYINPFIRNFFSIILNFIYIFYLNKKLSMVIAGCFFFSSLLTLMSSKMKKKRIKKINREKINNARISLESLNNMNIIKLFSTELHEYNKYSTSLNTILNLQIKKERFNLLHMILNKLFVTITYVLILLNGNYLLSSKQMDKKIFTSFFFYINNIYSYIDILDYYIDICDIVHQYHYVIKLIKMYAVQNEGLPFGKSNNADSILYDNENNNMPSKMGQANHIATYHSTDNNTSEDVLVCKTSRNEEKSKKYDSLIINRKKSALLFECVDYQDNDVVLNFKNVFFKYNSNPDNYILKNVNMKIYKNSNNVIIGKSGEGKSTLLKIILNLYKCTKGKIYLYNKLLNNYSSREIFDKITYVEQHSKLLKGTIKENLTYGIIDSNQFDMLDLINISKCCTTHEFICRLRKRYETVISNKTELLTSSQKQKICIARALSKYPKILLLDESTSAVDTENERAIFENIKRNPTFKNLTIIRITHKKANLDLSDNIFLLKGTYNVFLF
ncbi:ABC transporter B family member 3, putative [Plasmodium malariae]|uniref:ABC transporter B family member 3, putative n=1 Tax=Plasmodium malariae TaxID=5858 RepID=A0A1A8W1Z9_PLAMA|nr:ABC transporter B family member 3, putative [Plasmodium malariae]